MLTYHEWCSVRYTWEQFHKKCLTHWGRVTLICISKSIIIGSDNDSSLGQRKAIIWTNAGILLIEPSGTKFSELLIKIHTFSFKKMHLKMSFAKQRPFVSAWISRATVPLLRYAPLTWHEGRKCFHEAMTWWITDPTVRRVWHGLGLNVLPPNTCLELILLKLLPHLPVGKELIESHRTQFKGTLIELMSLFMKLSWKHDTQCYYHVIFGERY